MCNGKHNKSISSLMPCLLFTAILLSAISYANAANPIDKLSDIQNKIKSKLQQVRAAKLKETSIQTKINNIDSRINSKEKEIKQYDRRIAKSMTEVRSLENEIQQITEKLDKRTRFLNERIRAIHKRQYGGDALVLMTATDHQDLIRKSKYISLLAYYDSKIIKKYSSSIKEINAKKMVIENINNKLNTNRNTVKKKSEELLSSRANKDRVLAKIKSNRIAQEKKIKELRESSEKLQNMVRKFKNSKIPESIIGKGFQASKGELSWPVNGKVMISYGNYQDPELNTTIFKNGIEINAKKGDKPLAIAGGRVVYANAFKGYGNLLIIDHGSGYHSLYGNLSELALKTGELLIGGMEVGKVSMSKLLNVPTLYFEIRYKGKPVDPKPWLKKKG